MKTVLQRLVRYTGLSCALAGLCTLPAQAIPTLSLTPLTQSIGVGDTALVTLTLTVDDLDGQLGLGAWLVEFTYNDAVVSILSDYDSFLGPFDSGDVTFGTSLGQGVQFSLAGGGSVRADETSFEDPVDLMFSGSLELAKFKFTGVAPGTSNLEFTRVELSNAEGDPPLLAFTPFGAAIKVNGPTHGAPDTPVTLPLVAVVGLLLAFRRHGRRAA